MKTKHLFFAAALMTSFAACTSEDFMMDDMQSANTGTRPVVENVKLNFGRTAAETRMAYVNKSWAWQSTDTIGALLMDKVGDLTKANWHEKYTLTPYIHTSFPFTYNSADESWGCDTKMLEGNYFFAWPWEDYDGNRKVAHSLQNQQQTGVGQDVLAKSYADNQFFIGYSQIKAGTGSNEALKGVVMNHTLAAIQLQIKNNGTQTYKINKVVLSGNDKIYSTITIDPTNAEYEDYNLGDASSKIFNYANYIGENNAVNNSDDEYAAIEAIRKTMQGVDGENSAQLIIKGSDEERSLKNDDEVAYALIMCNPIAKADISGTTTGKELLLSIYTDEGMVQNIDLTKVHSKNSNYKVVTTSKVTEIGLNTVNTIGIHLDDNSFIVPEDMDIYNSSDLAQYIKWNNETIGTRDVEVTLKKDVVITEEMAEQLVESENTKMTFKGGAGRLILAKDVADGFFNSENVIASKLDIEVRNTLTLSKNSEGINSILVAENATLNIETSNAVVPSDVASPNYDIVNNGSIHMGEDAAVVSGVRIQNNGSLVLDGEGSSKATILNAAKATIKTGGYMTNVTNEKDGYIEVTGDNAQLKCTENNGVIKSADGSNITVSKGNGEVIFVEGAKIAASTNVISTEFGNDDIDDNTFKYAGISKLILTGDATFTVNEAKYYGYKAIEVTGEDVEITLGKNVTLDLKELIVREGKKLTLSGSGSSKVKLTGTGSEDKTNEAAELTIEEGAELYNNTAVEMKYAELNNSGVFSNKGTVYGYETVYTGGSWKFNDATWEDWKYTDPNNSATALAGAIEDWVATWEYDGSNFEKSYYDEDEDVTAFAAHISSSLTNDVNKKFIKYFLGETQNDDGTLNDDNGDPMTEAETKTQVKNLTFAKLKGKTENGIYKPNSTFAAAVKAEMNVAPLVTAFGDEDGVLKDGLAEFLGWDATRYESKAKAYQAFREKFNTNSMNQSFWPDATDEDFWGDDANIDYDNLKAIYTTSIVNMTDTQIENLLKNHTDAKYAYIWDDATTCPLYDVMTQYLRYTPDEWDEALNVTLERITDMATLKAFFKAAALTERTNSVAEIAKGLVDDYTVDDWKYSDAQFQAFPVKQKVIVADGVVTAINGAFSTNPYALNQTKLMAVTAVKNAVIAYSGESVATVDAAERAIEQATTNLSDDAAMVWARTDASDVVTKANAVVEKLTANKSEYSDADGVVNKVNGTTGTNKAMLAYWNALKGTNLTEKHDFNVGDVIGAVSIANTVLDGEVYNYLPW